VAVTDEDFEIIKKYAEATAKPAPEQEKVELGNGAGKLT